MFMLKNAHQPRFIDVEDGQFIEFRQTKESYYLETHQENQPLELVEVEINSDETPEDSSFAALKNKKGYLAFLLILLLMGFIIWNLSHVFWKETESYLNNIGPTLLQESSSDTTVEATLSVSKGNAILGYFIHTQHGINALYEETKWVVKHFSTGNLTQQEKVEKIENLIEALEEMEIYNHSYLGVETHATIKEVYQLNDSRLQVLKQGLLEIRATNYRAEAIETMNLKILEDQVIYHQQLEAFKTFLTEQQLAFYEKDGKLYFNFN